MATEYLYTEPVIDHKEEVKSGAGGYRFLAVLFFLLALGGLFIGTLGAVAEIFKPVSLPFFTESDKAFDMSLCGVIVTIFKNFGEIGNLLQSYFESSVSYGVWFVVYLVLVFFAMFAVLLSLILMIMALCAKSTLQIRRCAMASGIVAFLSFCGLFLFQFFFATCVLGASSFSAAIFDVPTAIIAGVILLALFSTAIARNNVGGLINTLILLLTVGTIFMVCYPGNLLAAATGKVFDATLYTGDNLFVGIALALLVAMLTFNFVVSVIRICAKRAFGFDAARFGVQLFAVLLTLLAYVVTMKNDRWGIFMAEGQAIPTSLLIALTIITFVVALTVSLVKKAKAQNNRQAEQAMVEYVGEPQPIPVSPAYVHVMPVETAFVRQEPVIVQQPIMQQPAPQQPQPTPQPAPQPQQEAPITEFERRMQALARGEVPVYETPSQPIQRQPSEPTSVTPTQKHRAPYASNYSYEGSQYMYDPFIKTLTMEEKNEFGDLFIANIYGMHSYLPTYVIGGDNKTFFDRVFIYLGSYRNYISQELLEKIYLFVSKLN
jgi:hypothetical protein